MRITEVGISPLDLKLETALTVAYGSYPVLEYALLRLRTDTGLIGLGEASPDPEVTGETQESTLEALKTVSGILEGSDPDDLEGLMEQIGKAVPDSPAVLAAVDMALFDLKGKREGKPVFELLGGLKRPKIPLYPVIPLETPEVMAETAARFREMEPNTFKIKLGTRPEEDLRRLSAVRAVVGDGPGLRLDINQGWGDAPTAVAAIGELDGFNVEWIEQPVGADDLEGMAEVVRSSKIPVMADESCHTPDDVLTIAKMKAADMINIKLMKCGGLAQALRMLDRAESFGLTCILGSMGESSIGSAAGLHLAAARPELVAAEIIGPLFIKNDPARGFDADPEDHHAVVSGRPGLGVDLK